MHDSPLFSPHTCSRIYQIPRSSNLGYLQDFTKYLLCSRWYCNAKMDQQGCYILGGCLIGSRITTTLILNGYEVLLKMVNQKFVEGRLGRVNGGASKTAKERR
ncbi:uncharacterized protein [Rutidosis leptorrhynchoides]|uniref:uncharacterized protein isoform X1 n=1 Tax=Rutidosis leptorrhynchoides TaxID=125765 RepID=UPI003A9A4F85